MWSMNQLMIKNMESEAKEEADKRAKDRGKMQFRDVLQTMYPRQPYPWYSFQMMKWKAELSVEREEISELLKRWPELIWSLMIHLKQLLFVDLIRSEEKLRASLLKSWL